MMSNNEKHTEYLASGSISAAAPLGGFDPDGVGVRNGNYFGMPFAPADAALVLLSVPWDVTSSYGDGASVAPEAIIEASTQLDFYDPWAPDEWRKGIATLPADPSIAEQSRILRREAVEIIAALESGEQFATEATGSRTAATPHSAVISDLAAKLARINAASAELNRKIETAASEWLAVGKLVGLVGGDHSTPLGLIRAVAAHHDRFGILHLDAHCDLRERYEGFDHSHASIIYNVLREVPQVERLVQVGVRDFSASELDTAHKNPKIVQFTGAELSENEFTGVSWAAQCERIIAPLPEKVYISFDIDFLSPEFCPNTGTPVPGGRTPDEATYLIRRIVDTGRTIVGFDLCEVSPASPASPIAPAAPAIPAAAAPARNSNADQTPDFAGDWDASVGARILFKLCGQALRRTTTEQPQRN